MLLLLGSNTAQNYALLRTNHYGLYVLLRPQPKFWACSVRYFNYSLRNSGVSQILKMNS